LLILVRIGVVRIVRGVRVAVKMVRRKR